MLALISLIRETEDLVCLGDIWEYDTEEKLVDLEKRLVLLHNNGLLFVGNRKYSNRKAPPQIEVIEFHENICISPYGYYMLEKGI